MINTALNYEALSIAMTSLFKQVSLNIMHAYETDFTTQYKDDNTPVTQADINGEKEITQALKTITPDIAVIGEETYNAKTHQTYGRFWLLDPIDGTRAFVAKNNIFTINAGLIENGKAIFGIVYSPLTDEMYIGSPLGAFKNGKKISVRSIPDTGAVIAMSFIPTKPSPLKEFLDTYIIDTYLELTSSIKICRIAEGQADLYPRFGPTSEWDTAAAHAVLHYAGGTIHTMDGNNIVYGKDEIENPHFICKGLE